MNEMNRYKNRIARRYKGRRVKTRHDGSGRRLVDHTVPFWNVGMAVQLIALILAGLCMIVLSGCEYVKKNLFGG